MKFLLKRYIHGILKRRSWILLVLVLPCLYLFISTIQADMFTVTQSIAISDSAPIALTSKPTGFILLKDIIANPDDFFQNSFAITTLSRDLFVKNMRNSSEEQLAIFIEAVKNNMSISITAKDMMNIQYHGTDMKTGSTLVSFYSKRLLQGAKEGLTRSNMTITAESLLPTLSEGLYIIEHRALWRSSRLVPMIQLIIISCLGVLVLLWGMEWSDSSFKSERQLGRYLNIPVLGSVPDLGSVTNMIESKPELV